jgi:hypothetical protein
VLRELGANYQRPLVITPPNPSRTVTNAVITLAGAAPITLPVLHLEQQHGGAGAGPEGLPASQPVWQAPVRKDPVWKDPAHWRFTNIHLKPGPNKFVVKGLDCEGKLLQEATMTVLRTNAPPAIP